MEKHPQFTLERIKRVVDALPRDIWLDARPLHVEVYQCPEPISYDEAIRQQYTPVAPGFTWGPAWSTAWFHVTGEYPAAWAGETVAALLDTGSEALVWVDGAPAQGLDPNRQDFVLDQRTPGKVDLYIEAAANQPFGFAPEFILRTASVARFNRPVWDFYHDLRVLYELAVQLVEHSPRRAQLIVTMNGAVNAYRRGGENAITEARAILADAYALPAAASASSVLALGHSHIDTAWLWPLRETVRKCARTFSTVLKYMEDYPEYRYVQSQPQLYAFMKQHFPALYARIKQAVAEGRWEPQGCMWVEADNNIPSGESLIRQILHGTRFFREEFGVENNVLWLPDVFGYTAAMPQILRGCGIPYFMTQKISWNQFNKFPHHTFWWEGIDGSRVLAHFPPADTYNGMSNPAEITFGERNFQDKGRSDTWMYLFGFGDGGGGVTKEMLEATRRMRDLEGLPKVEQGFAGEWFPRVEAEARDLCTWVGELYFELHRGTYTTQAKNKWENRRCEFLLRDAEFLAAVQPNGAANYPFPGLEHAWQLVLLNQFHDIIPGSSIHWVYEDSAKDYAKVHEIGEGIVANSLATFAAGLATEGLYHPIAIWNTLSFLRSGLVSVPWDDAATVTAVDPRGKHSRTQLTADGGEPRLLVEVVDAPSMGYTVYDLREEETEHGALTVTDEVTASERVLENGYLRVTLNDCGEVVELYEKTTERQLIPDDAAGNQFQLFDDHPNNYDAWDIDITFEEVGAALTAPATFTVLESGPLRAAVRIERELTPLSRLVQTIRLEANSRRLDFVTQIDWHESDKVLKVAFPVEIHSPVASYEIQYGHLERPTHRNTSWDMARFEVCAHKWADLSEGDFGVALLNDGKYGHDIHGNVMRLTLLRAPKSPDDRADMGAHAFTYSILPHRGNLENSGIPLAGYDLNVPLRAQELPVQRGALAKTHSYFKLDKLNLIIEAVKRAEDGDGIIIRLYEAYRRRGAAQLITNGLCARATRTDLLERDQYDLPVSGGAVTVPFKPFEIITLRLR